MISKVSGSTKLGIVFVLVACGGTPSQDSQGHDPPLDAGTVFDVSPGAPPPPASLGPVLAVTEGWVFLGPRYLDDPSRELKSEDSCMVGQDGAARHFWAAPFRMSRFEVTNAAYVGCVAEGCASPDVTTSPAWDSAAATNLPVIVSYPLARAFCRHYGGDLPTSVEWDRAASGDATDAYGIPSLTAAWLTCHFGGSGDICAQLASAVPDDPPGLAYAFPLAAVGSNAWDTGPFGHADLYGNAEEWVRSSTYGESWPGSPGACDLPDYGTDPLSFAAELQAASPVRQYGEVFDLPTAGYNGTVDVPHLSDQKGRIFFSYRERPWNQPAKYTGFRCAFPPGGG